MKAKRKIILIRAEEHTKAVIESAANRLGTNVSAFMLHYGYQAAIEILNDDSLSLPVNDWNAFIDAIEAPPKPNKKLKDLLKK